MPRSSSAAGGATRTRSSRSSSSPPCAFASQLGAAVGCLVVAGIAIGGVVTGDTPLAGDATTTAQIFQALFGFAAVSLLVLGVILSEREEANESLAEAQELAHIGSWEWEIAADRVTWSRELYRIFRSPPARGPADVRALPRTDPPRRPRSRPHRGRACAHGAAAVRVPPPHRAGRRNERVLQARGRVIVDAGGAPLRLASRRSIRARSSGSWTTSSRTRSSTHRRAQDEASRREMTRQLVTQAQRLQHLLADLLDVDRLRHGLVRASANGAANVAGTGIGLALVAQFAALQGGKAWVEDRPGGGASFRVSLPLGTD